MGWMEVNNLETLIEEGEKLLKKYTGSKTGYSKIVEAIPESQDAQQNKDRRIFGTYLLKSLPQDVKRDVNAELQQLTSRTLDGILIWFTLMCMMEQRTTVAKADLLHSLTTAKCGKNESVYEFGKRVRKLAQDLDSASDGKLQQQEEVVAQHILNGLPERLHLWKTAFEGRGDDEKSLERLLDDLRRIKDEETSTKSDDLEALAAMVSTRLGIGNTSCTKCGGQHHARKCTFSGKCFQCGKKGHKKLLCRSKTKQQLMGMKASATPLVLTKQDMKAWDLRNKKSAWILDSGSEEHTTPHLDLLDEVEDVSDHPGYKLANGEETRVTLKGKVRMTIHNKEGTSVDLVLESVYYLPGSPCNLLSEGALRNKGHLYRPSVEGSELHFNKGAFAVPLISSGNLTVMLSKPLQNIKAAFLTPHCWHQRLAHIGCQQMKDLQKHVEGLALDKTPMKPCEACPAGKSKRPSFPRQAERKVTAVNQTVHTDLTGKLPPDLNDAQYAQLFVDEYSREGAAYLLRNKSEAPEKLRAYIKEYDFPGRIRSDNAPELTRGEWGRICQKHRIAQDVTCPYTPQQNGIVERRLAVIEADAKAMCANASLPYDKFWGYAMCAANHVRNRVVSKGLHPPMTPYEKRTGMKPDISHLRVFGCVAFVHHPKSTRRKANFRATRGIFLGYANNTKGWLVLEPKTGKIFVSRDVTFHEDTKGGTIWEEDSLKTREQEEHNIVYDIDESEDSDEESEDENGENPSDDDQEEFQIDRDEDLEDDGDEKHDQDELQEQRRPQRNAKPPARIYNPNDIWHRSGHGGVRLNAAKIHVEDVTIPKTHQDVVKSAFKDEWLAAEQRELDGLIERKTFDVVPKANHKTVKSRFVYAVKTDSDGLVTKFKARIVAKGYTQIHGKDYNETYGPVGNTISLRMFLAIAAERRIKPRDVDCEMAFIHADLDETIHLDPPEGIPTPTGYSWRLKKRVYGLKQSSRNWNQTSRVAQ